MERHKKFPYEMILLYAILSFYCTLIHYNVELLNEMLYFKLIKTKLCNHYHTFITALLSLYCL